MVFLASSDGRSHWSGSQVSLVHKSGKQEIETGQMCSHVDAILVSCGLPVNLHPLPDLWYQALDSDQKNETADTIGQKKHLDIG